MGVEVPEEYGGVGSTFVNSLIVVEELAKVDPSISVLVDIHNTLIINILNKLGTSEQKQQWMPRLATDTISSFALSEAESGSDAFAMRTVAKADGDDFVINGSKMWISNSKEAGLFLLMANAKPEKVRRNEGKDRSAFFIGNFHEAK